MCVPLDHKNYRSSTSRTSTRKTLINKLYDGFSECINQIGGKWESYDGCMENLFYYLEEKNPRVTILSSKDDMYKEGYTSYKFTIDAWTGKYPVIVRFEK